MDWFYVNNVHGIDNNKVLINASAIMDVYYDKDTNLTVINFIRSEYPSLYVEGDILPDIKRLLSSHGHYVSQIGG